MASQARAIEAPIPHLRAVDPVGLIPAIADTGRYQISAFIPGASAITYCDNIELDRATLAPFQRANRINRDAQAGIYDMRAWRTVDSWRGGQAFGPVDPRHPVERLFARAIASGQRTSIITPGFSRTFNAGAAK